VWAALLVCLAACSFDHGKDTRLDTNGPGDAPRDVPGDPAPIDVNGPVSIVIEAELPSSTVSADGAHAWVVETTLSGFTGSGYITLLPNDFNHCLDPADPACGAFNTYDITIPVAGMYRVMVRHRSTGGSNDSVFWYAGSVTRFENLDPDTPGMWIGDSNTTSVALSAGATTFALRSRETGSHIDSIRLDLE